MARDPGADTPRLRHFLVKSGGNVTLESVTLSGGAPGSSAFDGAGGQFYVQGGGVVSITNSTLTGGFTTFGGAINNEGGTLILNNSTLSGNAADLSTGGAINNYRNGDVTLLNCTVFNNSAGSRGGAINNEAGTLRLTNTIVAGNPGATSLAAPPGPTT